MNDDTYHDWVDEAEGYPHSRCEDAPCCGHGGICGQAIGMSYSEYEAGYDDSGYSKDDYIEMMIEDDNYYDEY